MAMSPAERAHLDARELLAQERSIDKAARRLAGRGMAEAQARSLVEQVFHENRAANRRTAIAKIGLSALALVVFGGVLLFTGYLFYILLPVAAIGLLWGLIQFATASGIEIAAGGGD